MSYQQKYAMASDESEMTMELTSMDVVDEQEDIGYTTYGLRVLDVCGDVLYEVPDIDTSKDFVQRFVEFCSQSDVRLMHIPDLLEDYMAAGR